MAGLTRQGFSSKRFSEIRSEIIDEIEERLGPINTGEESVVGHIIDTVSERESELWELAESVYYSQYPSTATGRSLDRVVAINGLSRRPASRSFADVVLLGDHGTAIPAGSRVKNSDSLDEFETTAENEIDRSSCLVLMFDIDSDTGDFEATINGQTVSVSANDKSEPDIAEELASEINSLDAVSAKSDDKSVRVVAEDFTTTFSVQALSKEKFDNVQYGTPVEFRAVEPGGIDVFVGLIDEIITPVSGWNGVETLTDGTRGNNEESDAELRERYKDSLQIVSAATEPAIRARILDDVDDVVSASVVSNRSPDEDEEGRPPHSFELIVSGGTEQDIAEKLWEIKPAGIESFGNTSVTVVDSENREQVVRFTRPADAYIWIRTTIRVGDSREPFPESGDEQVKTALFEHGDMLEVGDPVIYQSFYKPIFSVPGILEVENLEVAQTDSPEDPPDEEDWKRENIKIDSNVATVFSKDRIIVNVNDERS